MEFKNSKSIYLQIADNLSEKVMDGTHPPGDKIPSVRDLAASMGVNPNTVMRTYSELQSRQIIENKRGIGYFVSENAKRIILDWKRKDFFETELPEFIRQLQMLGISYQDLKPYFDQTENQISNENK